jgi:uncharacterized protein YukE
MLTTGEKNERRATFAMQKYKHLNLPVCYQHISGSNPTHKKNYMLAKLYPGVDNPAIRAEYILKDLFKANFNSIKNLKVTNQQVTMTLGYVSITLTMLELEQLRNELNKSPKLQENLTDYLQARYGTMLPNISIPANALKNINIVRSKAKFVLDNTEYNAFNETMNSLSNTLTNKANKPSQEALNSLNQNLNTLNNSLKSTGNSLSDFQKNMQANITATKQAFKNGQANIKRVIADVNEQAKKVQKDINGFSTPPAEQKLKSTALASGKSFTLNTLTPYLQNSSNNMSHIGVIDGTIQKTREGEVFRIRIGQANPATNSYDEIGQFAVFTIPLNEVQSFFNQPNALSQLNKHLKRGTRFPAFDPATKEGVKIAESPVESQQIVLPGGTPIDPDQNPSTFKDGTPANLDNGPGGVAKPGQFNPNRIDPTPGAQNPKAVAGGTDGSSQIDPSNNFRDITTPMALINLFRELNIDIEKEKQTIAKASSAAAGMYASKPAKKRITDTVYTLYSTLHTALANKAKNDPTYQKVRLPNINDLSRMFQLGSNYFRDTILAYMKTTKNTSAGGFSLLNDRITFDANTTPLESSRIPDLNNLNALNQLLGLRGKSIQYYQGIKRQYYTGDFAFMFYHDLHACLAQWSQTRSITENIPLPVTENLANYLSMSQSVLSVALTTYKKGTSSIQGLFQKSGSINVYNPQGQLEANGESRPNNDKLVENIRPKKTKRTPKPPQKAPTPNTPTITAEPISPPLDEAIQAQLTAFESRVDILKTRYHAGKLPLSSLKTLTEQIQQEYLAYMSSLDNINDISDNPTYNDFDTRFINKIIEIENMK